MKRFPLVLAGVALALGALVTSTLPASATPPSGYGFDGNAHLIVGGGSDTTYKAMVNISTLYNGSAGCQVKTATGATTNVCITSQRTTAADGNTTNGSTTVTSATGNFSSANDVGATITGAGIPAGTTIASVSNATTAVLSAAATATATTTVFTISNYVETNTLGDYGRDSVVQVNPTGSSAGVQSLNDPSGTPYSGVPGGAIDFARSSREPKLTGGNGCSNELTCDTFWGFAQDGIEVWAFNNRAAEIQGLSGSALDPANTLAKIFNCTFTTWDQVTGNAADAGQPIVVWGMNSSSGTYNVFRDYMRSASGGNLGGSYDPDSQACMTKLGDGSFPLENNLAPLIADKATSTSPTSVNNPENWIGWGSFGELSTFPFKNGGTSTVTSVVYTGGDLPINGARPTPGNIGNNTWAIGRTLYHVTKNTDADCPQTVPGTCDFAGIPGPVITGSTRDLNVTGGSSGTSGAIREFTRFLCRVSTAQHSKDPYTGTNNFTGITSGIAKAGYQIVPSGLRTSGSRCHVIT